MSQAEMQFNGSLRHLQTVNSEIDDLYNRYMAIPTSERRGKSYLRPFFGADIHYASGERTAEVNIEKVVLSVLDKGELTRGGNDATKSGVVVSGTAKINLGIAYDYTDRGHQDFYKTWAQDGSTIDSEETVLPFYLVIAAQSDVGGMPIDRGQRAAVTARSFNINNELLGNKAKSMHKALVGLKGETVSLRVQGNVIYCVKELETGPICVAFMPFNQRTVGVGEKTYTDSRKRTRKVASGPMAQICDIGGIELGHTKSSA